MHKRSVQEEKVEQGSRFTEQAKLSDEDPRSLFWHSLWVLVVTAILTHFWPNLIAPYTLFSLWHSTDTVTTWLCTSWPVFAWGWGVTIAVSVLSKNSRYENSKAEENFAAGLGVSVMAGFLEEICFRWLSFLSGIISAIVVNWLFFGWAGFGVVQWLVVNLLGPVANFFTISLLSDPLTNPALWATGSAILGANAAFRDGHKYLGWFGYLNSWFIGMFFFYLMFRFGLPAAILVHFFYDAGIFFVRYLDNVIERASANG